MTRPRRLSDAERARRRELRSQRRAERLFAADPQVTMRSVRRARTAFGVALAGLAVGTVGAWWFASSAPTEELRWGLGLGGRHSGGIVLDVLVSPGHLVPLAAVVTGLPVVVALVGLWRTPATARPGRRAATSTSVWSWVGAVLALGAAPNVLGCYAVSHVPGRWHDLMLLPMLWPQLSFFFLFYGAAAWVLTERRRRRAGRTGARSGGHRRVGRA
ncbi:hypothetical protein GXB85_02600 [Cellulomonas sp. APG4]|uniref:hypothetical protein n=1 Tax=Cellulomonas sp. APG4 TaxID=1538656 RepID=UPI0013799AF0|nr:hypothetical protein [Cellulomonas sp. APG4]NCT89847.1 hypothetical protein [Cellulomonas sp. APG4]